MCKGKLPPLGSKLNARVGGILKWCPGKREELIFMEYMLWNAVSMGVRISLAYVRWRPNKKAVFEIQFQGYVCSSMNVD